MHSTKTYSSALQSAIDAMLSVEASERPEAAQLVASDLWAQHADAFNARVRCLAL